MNEPLEISNARDVEPLTPEYLTALLEIIAGAECDFCDYDTDF